MPAAPELALAIIGGTGLYALADLQDIETHQPVTRYGAPSGPIRIGTLAGKRVAFLARHGEGHSLPPHKINYRANLAALRRFDSRCFGDRLLRRWLDGCWRDNFRSINDQRLGGRYRLDDYRLSGYWFHGSRLDGDRRSGNGFNDGNRGRYGLDSFRDAGVLNLNLFRLLILRTNHRVADPDFTGSHLRRCAGYGQRHRRLGRIAFVTIATTTLTADAQVTRGTT